MTRLSNRQFPMLQAFTEMVQGKFMTIEHAQAFDQRPFRSMLMRKWVAYSPGHGFHCTQAGRSAYYEFLNTDIARKNPQLPLTAYFDAAAYGLKAKPRKKREAA